MKIRDYIGALNKIVSVPDLNRMTITVKDACQVELFKKTFSRLPGDLLNSHILKITMIPGDCLEIFVPHIITEIKEIEI